jgi:hypothetical protein
MIHFGLILGQSQNCKKVMFCLYRYNDTCFNSHVNPLTFIRICGSDLETAKINAMKFGIPLDCELQIWDDEAIQKRLQPNPHRFPKGKYEGKTLDEIMEIDAQYVFWASKNMNGGSVGFQENLKVYFEISKELITTKNEEIALAHLPIEDKAIERVLIITSESKLNEFSGLYDTKFVDEVGNKFKYTGKQIDGVKGSEIIMKCKVKFHNTYLGINTNIIRLR